MAAGCGRTAGSEDPRRHADGSGGIERIGKTCGAAFRKSLLQERRAAGRPRAPSEVCRIRRSTPRKMLETLQTVLLSTGVVAAAEIGDKTMLLAVLLAARFRRPLVIILGIFVATLLNHAIAGAVGAALASFISEELLRWILIVSFVAMGIWILVPDRMDDDGEAHERMKRFGVFGTTVVLFFLAEVGDKTQVATVALAARYPLEALWVICGTTLGLMIADAPAVYVGDRLAERISMAWMRRIAAAVFFILAAVAWLQG